MNFPAHCSRSLFTTRRGFTLLEIMVVLAILGLLVSVLVRSILPDMVNGEKSAASLFVNSTLAAPLTSFRIHTGDFPTTAQGLQALITKPQDASHWRGPYYDAKSGNLPLDPWKRPYEYRYPGTHNKNGYDLFSAGPDKTVGTEDDIGNWE